MDEAQEENKVAVNLPQEKIDFINQAHAKRNRILEECFVL